jgi:hypothetical protein
LQTNNIIWLEDVVHKLAWKHKVEQLEVEEVLRGKPKYRYVERGSGMAKSKTKKLPRFTSTRERVDFFDTHDMGPYLDALPEAHFEFSQKRSKVLTEIDPKLSDELSKIARAKGISSTRLLNSILRKGIKQEKQAA